MSWLLILKRKQKISSNAFRIGTFLFRSCSFGIETINTFIRSRSSFENHTRFHTPGQSLYPFSDPTAQKPYPLGRHIPTWLTYRSSQHPALMWYWLFDSYFFYKLPLITSSTLQEIFDVFRFTFLSFSAKALRNTVFYIVSKLYMGLFQWAPEQVNIKRPSSPLPRGFVYYNKTVFHHLWLCTMTWWML